MGVKQLWQELDDAAHETTLEVLAAAAFLHDGDVSAQAAGPAPSSSTAGAHTKHCGPVRRHLVLGIDASIWLFHAISLRKTLGDRGDIRMLFFRLAKLHSLPILPVFVFDGPDRPQWKRNKQRGKCNARYAFPNQADFEELIRLFGFASFHAPAEAEAQLARMNAEGTVDAILTDDGDAFLFGAQIVLRNASKTLSGSQARANRLRRRDEHDGSGGELSEAVSQASTSSSRSRASKGAPRKGKRQESSVRQESLQIDDDADSDVSTAYTPTPSEGSDDDEQPNKGKGKERDGASARTALTGKIEESYTAYRSFRIFNAPRSHADERLFGSRKPLNAPPFYEDKDPSTKTLDQDGLILVALLHGGDYDMKGLPRCGIKTSIALARCGYGKRLLDAFRRFVEAPRHAARISSHAASSSASTPSSSTWNRELTAWVNDVRNELRTNHRGLLERKAGKLASSGEWDDFLQTKEAMDVVRSYVWPNVVSVTIQDVLKQSTGASRRQKSTNAPIDARIPSFEGSTSIPGPSRLATALSARPASSTDDFTPAQCDLGNLCQFLQVLFGWDTSQAMKRFSSLIWDGCVLRKAISLQLHLDQKREAGQPIPEAPRPSAPPAPSSPKKKKAPKRVIQSSSGDVTITPQARRFADFFEKNVQLTTPSKPSRSAAFDGSPTQTEPDPDPKAAGIRPGEIRLLAIHGTRKHVVYGGLVHEVRISYTTDGLKKAVEGGLVKDWARGEDGLYAPRPRRSSQDGNANSDSEDSVSEEKQSTDGNGEEDDEFITLSQVQRKQKQKNKVNDSRMWIPRPYIDGLPFFEQPSTPNALDYISATQTPAPVVLLEEYDQAQRDKAEMERIKIQNREARKTGKKTGKLLRPDDRQRAVTDFFSVAPKSSSIANTAAGKGKGRALMPSSSTARARSKAYDSFSDEFPDDRDTTARAIRMVGAAERDTNGIHSGPSLSIPARVQAAQESASQSDNSVVLIDTPPATATRRTNVPRNICSDPATSDESQPQLSDLHNNSDAPSSSEVDELTDGAASSAPTRSTRRIALPSFTSRLAQTAALLSSSSDAENEEEGVEDDSLPDIRSQRHRSDQTPSAYFPCQSSPVATGALAKARAGSRRPTRPASQSPLSGSEDSVGLHGPADPKSSPRAGRRGPHRSPRKSPRNNQGQTYAWSSTTRAGPSSAGQPASSSRQQADSLPDTFQSESLYVQEQSEDEEEDGSMLDSRPVSPSPRPKRRAARVAEITASQDTSASFEIVDVVPARSKVAQEVVVIDDDSI